MIREDTAHIACYVFFDSSFQDLYNDLVSLQPLADQTQSPEYLVRGAHRLRLEPRRNQRRKHKGAFFGGNSRWILVHEALGIELHLTSMVQPQGGPNVIVVLRSSAFDRGPFMEILWPTVEDLVGTLGGMIADTKVSRVDVAVDLVGLDYGKIYQLFLNQTYVCRGRWSAGLGQHRRFGRRRPVSFEVGSHPLKCRIYDKEFELSRKAPQFQAAWMQRRFGGPVQGVARVEFQLAKRLTSQPWRGVGGRIRTVQDWASNRHLVMAELVGSWLRFYEPPFNHHVPSRSRIHPFWQRVQMAVATLAPGLNPGSASVVPQQAAPAHPQSSHAAAVATPQPGQAVAAAQAAPASRPPIGLPAPSPQPVGSAATVAVARDQHLGSAAGLLVSCAVKEGVDVTDEAALRAWLPGALAEVEHRVMVHRARRPRSRP